jgi:1,4-alpha-glucan branching enzyme
MRAVYRDRSGRWWWRAAAAAAIAATIIVTAGLWRLVTTEGPRPVAGHDSSSFVQFVYVGPEAHAVSLVGSFNDWDPRANPLQRDGRAGVWSAEISLPSGHHEYAFNVDGRWVPDDDAPTGASDEFGVTNSVILVQ